jgi:hypothetical protein
MMAKVCQIGGDLAGAHPSHHFLPHFYPFTAAKYSLLCIIGYTHYSPAAHPSAAPETSFY